MNVITEYYDHADLAIAAYANLTYGISGDAYRVALQQDGDGMSASQAADFVVNWRVIDQYNDVSNSLSVTVFESVATSGRYLAVRGTDDLLDVWTDFIDITILGTPERQAQYASLRDQVDAWLTDGTLTSGYTVTGHSLGGFLAGALLVDYPTEVGHVYMYNAPGVGGLSAGLRLLAGLENEPNLELAKVSNLIAEAGPSLAAGLGLDWGAPIPVTIEDQSPDVFGNHRIVHLIDALAVQSLLGKLSSTEYIGLLNEILRAATPQNAMTLETVVNAMGELFQAGIELTGTESDPRDALYQAIYAIQDNTAYQAAEGTVDVVSLAGMRRDAIATQAKTDIAYRYALVNLDPFTLIGNKEGNRCQREIGVRDQLFLI